MKRFVSVLLASLLLLAIAPLSAFAETVTDSQGVMYTLSGDGTYYIVTACDYSVSEVIIPAEINGLPVKEIGDFSFIYGNYSLTSVSIPNTVTSIGIGAFSDCSSLTEISISDSVASIGSGAFAGCGALEKITVDTNNQFYRIEKNCLIETASSTLIKGCNNSTVPDSVTSIGDYAFSNCTKLTNVSIPNSVTSIGMRSFFYCTGLASVSIPNSVTSIGEGAFYGCRSLTEISIPNSVTSIGKEAFKSCTKLTNVSISNSVTFIGDAVFESCNSLTKISIPNSVTSIGSSAFAGCGLTEILIPNSVTSIGAYAFRGCKSLTDISIPNSVTSIGDYAFNSCYGLTSIFLPNSVTSIGDSAFYDCESLTDIYCEAQAQPEGWSYDWQSNCNAKVCWSTDSHGLTYTLSSDKTYYIVTKCANFVFEVTIPSKFNELPVKEIGDYAFQYCPSLTSVSIPDSVTYISNSAFYNRESLEEITVDANNQFYHSEGNCLIETASNTLVRGSSNSTIPNSVTSIGAYAFSGCKSLTDIFIPNSVTSIGNQAFAYCYGLTGISIPNSVTSIGDQAFNSCDSLTGISIPNSVTSIGNQAFAYCDGLTSIYIPDTVTYVGWVAFSGCKSLTDIYCEAEEQPQEWSVIWNSSCDATVHWGHTLYKEGDISGDGSVDMFDYIMVKSYYFNLYTMSEDEASRADINKDGFIDMFDYIAIKSLCI